MAYRGRRVCDTHKVALSLNETVVAREFGAFRPIKDSYPKLVLSMDKLDFSQGGIRHRSISDWLLEG